MRSGTIIIHSLKSDFTIGKIGEYLRVYTEIIEWKKSSVTCIDLVLLSKILIKNNKIHICA